MTTRSEKERQKHLQEKYQAALANLLKDDDNKYCVDCDAKGPRWASWNLGIFLCIRCAGIHRNLGVHISKVKSVNLDTWTAEQVAMMMEVGNSRARAAYEAQVPDNFRRPQTDSALEAFIRAKYEQKKYMAREWVPPKPTIPKELEQDERAERKKKPKQQSSVQLEAPKVNTPKSQPAEKKPTEPPPQLKQSSNTEDLLSLNSSPAKQAPAQSSDLLGDLVDIMGPTTSASQSTSSPSSQPANPQAQQNGVGDLEASLFDDGTAKQQEKSTKDSILALYGPKSQPQQQMYGVPGGMYMPQQQQMGQQNMGMYGMGNAVMQQQPMMNNQYSQQNPQGMPMQQQNMYGMMGQQNMQPNMGMYNQPNQQQMAMQYNQMQQQMGNMRLNSNNMMGQPNAMGNWGVQGNSGHTLSTNLWQ